MPKITRTMDGHPSEFKGVYPDQVVEFMRKALHRTSWGQCKDQRFSGRLMEPSEF
jgi:hypothetical protein